MLMSLKKLTLAKINVYFHLGILTILIKESILTVFRNLVAFAALLSTRTRFIMKSIGKDPMKSTTNHVFKYLLKIKDQ